jgi:hypothetical protein
MRLIDTIKFVDEYCQCSKGQGGKKWIMHFRRREFQELVAPDEFKGLTAEAREALMVSPGMGTRFAKWQREHEGEVTAMNRVYDMYQAVSLFHAVGVPYLTTASVRCRHPAQSTVGPSRTTI